MSTYTVSTIEELAAVAELFSEGDGSHYYVVGTGSLIMNEDFEIPGLVLSEGNLSCAKGFHAAGDVYVNGGVSVTGDFKARYVSIHGEGVGNLSVGGNVEVAEDLYTSGAVSVGGNFICGYVNINGDASVSGDVLIQEYLYAGSAIIGGNLSAVNDVVSHGGLLSVGKSINVGGYIVAGSVTAGKSINVTKYIVCDGQVIAG